MRFQQAPGLVHQLERLPGFRNIVVHEDEALDLRRVVDAMQQLDPIREFLAIAAGIEAEP